MARTNQAAKRSTGGKAPRKKLQTKAARVPQGRNVAVPAEPISYVMEWLLLSQDEQYKKKNNIFLMEADARAEAKRRRRERKRQKTREVKRQAREKRLHKMSVTNTMLD